MNFINVEGMPWVALFFIFLCISYLCGMGKKREKQAFFRQLVFYLRNSFRFCRGKILLILLRSTKISPLLETLSHSFVYFTIDKVLIKINDI